jgi:hypothetical protein
MIVLAAQKYTLTIPNDTALPNENAAATGDLDLTDDVDIVGQGAGATVVDANQLDRGVAFAS